MKSAFLLATLLLASLAAPVLALSGTPVSYHPITVNLTDPLQILAYATANTTQYSVAAYDPAGTLVASSTSKFSSLGLLLPTGSYLLIGTARGEIIRPVPLARANSSTYTYPPTFLGAYEYGFLQINIDRAANLTISTQPLSAYPASNITVRVDYSNGTAADGASVYAYPVGGYWPFINTGNLTVLGTTVDGAVALDAPEVPLIATAWQWVPMNASSGENQTAVSGQPINTTRQPIYIGLSGSALIVPPASSATITMHAQPPQYWANYNGIAYASGGAAIASSPGGQPASVANAISAQATPGQLSQSISFGPPQTTLTSSSGTNLLVFAITIVVGVVLGVTVAKVVRRGIDASK